MQWRYNATLDEQKLLWGIIYLNQLSTDNFLDDYSGQDVTPPNKVSNITHSFTDDGFININLIKQMTMAQYMNM